MFSGTFNLAGQDLLDWGVILAAALAILAWALRSAAGVDLFQPRSSLSLISGIAAIGAATFVALWLADWFWPVRVSVYLVNAENQPMHIDIGDHKGCLMPKSFVVLTWRWNWPKTLEFIDPVSDSDKLLTLSPGTWIANPSGQKISADLSNVRSMAQNTVSVDQEFAVNIKVASGGIYRIFSDLPMDRVFSPEGDVLADKLKKSCGTEDGRKVKGGT